MPGEEHSYKYVWNFGERKDPHSCSSRRFPSPIPAQPRTLIILSDRRANKWRPHSYSRVASLLLRDTRNPALKRGVSDCCSPSPGWFCERYPTGGAPTTLRRVDEQTAKCGKHVASSSTRLFFVSGVAGLRIISYRFWRSFRFKVWRLEAERKMLFSILFK